MDLAGWFNSNNLSENLRTLIPRVVLVQEPEQSSSDSNVYFDLALLTKLKFSNQLKIILSQVNSSGRSKAK